MFSIESIATYNKLKLQDGNLYMNNSRVGIEEFKSGKNIEISNHMFNLADNVNISGNMTVDGIINANQIVMEFFEVPDSKIDRLDNIDISTERIHSNHLSIETNGFTIDAGDLSFHTNDICMNSRYISICAEDIYINDGFWIQKYGNFTISGVPFTTDYITIKNLYVTDNIIIPDTTSQVETIEGTLTAANDLIVKGVLYSNAKIVAI